MKLTKQLKAEIADLYEAFWGALFYADIDIYSHFLDEDYRLIGTTEQEFFFSKAEAVRFLKATADQLAGNLERRNSRHKIEIIDNLVFITDQFDAYVLIDDKWSFYEKTRVTTLLQEKKDGWKIIQQHFSFPDNKAGSGQTIGLEKIAKENLQLKEAIRRRTIELELKNKELEIEFSLERVRAVAMGMKQPADMLEVCEVITRELISLGVGPIRNIQTAVIDTEKETYQNYEYYQVAREKLVTTVAYKEHPTIHAFVKRMVKDPEGFYARRMIGEGLKKWLKYQAKAGQFVDPTSTKVASLHYYFYSIGSGALGITTYAPLSKEAIGLFKRFRNVFQLAYARFIDIQQAVAQTREAQIEASLERVRSRAMAMHNSAELKVVALELRKQMGLLGQKDLEVCAIHLYDDDHSFESWSAMKVPGSANEILQTQARFPKKGIRIVDELMKNYNEGEKDYVIVNAGAKSVEWFSVLKEYAPELHSSIMQAIGDMPLKKLKSNWSVADFSGGALVMVTYGEPDPASRNLLRRSANVFEQAYIRFQDLKKAEAQAKEAQIEAALEKVRSRTMAMQSSNELQETAAVLFQEFKKLGAADMQHVTIGIYNEEERVIDFRVTSWANNGEQENRAFRLDMDEPNLVQPAIAAWKAGKKSAVFDLTGEALQGWLNYRNKISGITISSKDTGGRRVISAAYFSKGHLTISSPLPLPEETIKILERFAAVFDGTYTRFLDLEKAEAQVREAQIEAALERVRSRTLAMQKSDELAETAAVLFQQLIALGIEPNRLYISIINSELGETEFWITDEEGRKVSTAFTAKMQDNATFLKMYEGWKQQQKSLVIDMQGEELQNYFRHLTGLGVSFKGGLEQKRRIQEIAYFSKGFIGMASPEEQPAETLELLERFAAVFNLTFTRFNDLKMAEAHARQAELDLIAIKEAKLKAEEALSVLQATQKQLVQAEKMASLGELTAGIAHEIQNPLNFVNNFSEVSKELLDEMREAIEKGDAEEAKEIMNDVIQNLEKINHHGKRADGIVKGMLQHSRSSSGVKEPTDINALADEYLRLAYHGLRAKDKSFNATLKTEFDDTIGNINVIPQDIGRVILNLITNAFYAVDEKKKQQPPGYEPTVTVTTRKLNTSSGEAGVVISVNDNGNGITRHVIDKIFQPFFTTKPTGQGTGLGLSLSYDIVKAHGGELKVETTEGEGSGFIITLPV